MGLKDLFINSEENANDKPKKVEPVKETKTKFPNGQTEETTSTSLFGGFGFNKPTVTPQINSNQISQEHLAKAIEIYQNGFDSLNQPGYDFYEYYQAVVNAGSDNPMAFTMAFNMGKSMDKSLTKETLVQQSEFYVSEITKVYNDYITKGNSKKQELITQKGNENQALVNELQLLKQQLESINIQIQDRESKLSAIGSKYEPKISEIDSKLAANDLAKDKVIQSIQQVKQGIINNIK